MTRQFFLRSTTLLGCWISSAWIIAESNSDRRFWNERFQNNQVLELEILLTPAAWAAMEPTRRSSGRDKAAPGGTQRAFPYVRANLRVGDVLLKDIGLRYKGNSSYNASSRKLRRPFKIDTNRFVSGQKLFGRTKLNLSTAFLDSTFMKEKLAYDVYRAAGLLTPGVGWANVILTIEGVLERQALGVYVMIEQIDRGFLERQIGSAASSSVLMKPEGVGDWPFLGRVTAAYKRYGIKCGEDNERELSAFAETLRLIEFGGQEDFQRRIGNRIDVGSFAGYLAATSLLVNFDSYIGSPHNYYLLIDARDRKLRIVPWDLNESFGGFLYLRDSRARKAEQLVLWGIDKPWVTKRTVLRRLFELREFRELYHATLLRLTQQVFNVESMSRRVRELEQVLRPFALRDRYGEGVAGLQMGIAGNRNGIDESIGRRIFAILPFVRHRLLSVQAQMAGSSEGIQFFR